MKTEKVIKIATLALAITMCLLLFKPSTETLSVNRQTSPKRKLDVTISQITDICSAGGVDIFANTSLTNVSSSLQAYFTLSNDTSKAVSICYIFPIS